MKGRPEEARAYCQKLESRVSYVAYVDYCEKNNITPRGTQGPYEVGKCPGGQGRRSDLIMFTESMASGKTLKEVALANPTTFVKHSAGFQKLAFYMGQDAATEWREVRVDVYYGATGVGKTRYAIEKAKEDDRGWFLMRLDAGKTMWWDGYTGQGTIILDEYHGNWLPYKGLLGILDGHPLRVPIKGGHEWARWTTVLITSSTTYTGWYARQEYSELERRVDMVTYINPLADKIRPKARSGGNNSPTSGVSVLAQSNGTPPTPMLLDLGGYNADDVANLDEYGKALLISDEEIGDILAGIADIPMEETTTSSSMFYEF